MLSRNHDFVEVDATHRGWRRYEFEWEGQKLALLTIEEDLNRSDQRAHSNIHDRGIGPLPTMSFSGILTVNAAVEILNERLKMHQEGERVGYQDAQRDIRRALGL